MSTSSLPPAKQQIDLSHACYSVSATELDAANNIVSKSPHTQLKLLPNHRISLNGELEGFLFQAHHEDRAAVLPFPPNMFDMMCMYEIKPPNDSAFNSDVLHILNNIQEYQEAMKDVHDDLSSDEDKPQWAHFDCIPEEDSNANSLISRLIDQREWRETVPRKMGLYHAFGINSLTSKREHKLYIIIEGNMIFACEDLHNLWQETRNSLTSEQFADSEELAWLRQATLRNHNRIASIIAKKFNLSIKHSIDTDDPTGKKTMVYPTTTTYFNDIRRCPLSRRVTLTNNASMTDTTVNGILFNTLDMHNYWLLRGPRDLTDGNTYGTQLRNTNNNVMPTTVTTYHHTFHPPPEVINSVWKSDADSQESILRPNEQFMRHLEQLGFNRNDGVLHLMPIVVCD